jgi:methionyl-tRNA synthetase
MLGQGAEARGFASLGEAGRLRPGTALPAPAGVFPRYVEPKDEAEKKPEPNPKPKKKAPKG